MKKKVTLFLLFLLTAVLITLMLPKHGIFKYDFKRGETWQYETLLAPFDFPLHKTARELSEEVRNTEDRTTPFFVKDSILSRNYRNIFVQDMNLTQARIDSIRRVMSRYPNRLVNMEGIEVLLLERLTELYNRGIYLASERELVSSGDSGEPLIRMVDGTRTYTTSLSSLSDVQEARNALFSVIEQHSEEDMIRNAIDLDRYIAANVRYDDYLTRQSAERQQRNISRTKGIISAGTPIVSENQLIDDETYQVLESLRLEYGNRIGSEDNYWWILSGIFLYVLVIMLASFVFLEYFRPEFLKRLGNLAFILFLYLLMAGLTVLVGRTTVLSIYIVPYAVIPLYIMTFYDVRLSMFEYASILLICAIVSPFPFDFFFLHFMAGISGILVLRNSYSRKKLFTAVGAVLATYVVGYFALSLIQNGDILLFRWTELFWFVGNALLLIAMYQLVYPFEKIFGFVTNITLLELSDTNQPLLLELAQKAPGTFQHSLQVANLAEAAAKEIGANPLLARTGALYHDIGKIYNPVYFIENVSNEFNPHNNLEPTESAEIIRHHVTEGIRLAKRERLPAIIINFIESHHSDSRIYYFYSKQKEKYGEGISDAEFRYPGPKPQLKEVSICMMADAVEAASRTLSDYSESSVRNLVNKIIDVQIQEGNFTESDLEFREVAVIKEVLVRKIAKMYHTRVVYPDRN